MSRHNTSASPPVYELYGEQAMGATLDGLHCESIADRSRLHNWEIQPHRHAALLQLLLIEQGRAQVRLDAEELSLRSPCLVLVPPLVVHGFRFAPDTAGLVLTLDQPQLARQLQASPGLLDQVSSARALTLEKRSTGAAELLDAARWLAQEYASAAPPWRRLALDSAIARLVLAVARLQPAIAASERPGDSRSLQHLARYRAEIERRYREQPSVAALAQPLGITPTQLNRLCQRELGCSALALLHQRLLLEAKRELSYTTLPIRQIADGLGFADPAYFTRFFQRLAGQSPSHWRAQAAGSASLGA